MKGFIQKMATRLGGCMACAALAVAGYSVSSTCLFMTYQPDVPEELL